MTQTAKKKSPIRKVKIVENSSGSMIEKISDRQTEELVLALCGSVGSGTSTIAEKLSEIFKFT